MGHSEPDGTSPEVVTPEVGAPTDAVDNADNETENSLPRGMAFEVVAPDGAVGSADKVVLHSGHDGVVLEVADNVTKNSSPGGVAFKVVVPNSEFGSADKVVENSAPDGIAPEVDAIGNANDVVQNSALDDVPFERIALNDDQVVQGAEPGVVHPLVPAQVDVAEDIVETIEDRLHSVYVLIPEGFEDLPIDMIFDDAMQFRISDTCRRSVPQKQFQTLWPSGRRQLLDAMQQGLEESGRGPVMHGLELGAAQRLIERLAEFVTA